METNNFKNEIIDLLRKQNKKLICLPKGEELLLFLHNFFPVTGQLSILFCNGFLQEATQLLINSIFLYQDGLFDCAFYSIRQANEVMDSMLYLSMNDKGVLTQWSSKKAFPFDGDIKRKIEKLSTGYKEIKTLIPEFFQHHSELITKANKIIHKQGFDTFYYLRFDFSEKTKVAQRKEIELFSQYLIHSIGVVLILFIVLEPISLALADENIDSKIPFNLLTEPVDLGFFSKYLGQYNIIEKIIGSRFYKEFSDNFIGNDPMLPSVYSVIREEAWDLDSLEEIEKQLDLLNIYERFMFYILKNGIRVSIFYYYGGTTWYFTTRKSNFERKTYGGQEFIDYLKAKNKFNQPCENVFISVVMMYGEPLFLEHNELLKAPDILILQELESQSIKAKQEFNQALEDITQKGTH